MRQFKYSMSNQKKPFNAHACMLRAKKKPFSTGSAWWFALVLA
jgi:hypothetical protein